MSKDVKGWHLSKWSAMSPNQNLLSSAKLKRFLVIILGWKDLCNSFQYVTLSYHPLEIVELGVEHSGGRPQGGIGAAAHFASSEARLMWIAWLMVSKPILPRYHRVVNGLNGSGPSETYTYITPFLATSGRKSNDVPCMARPSAIIVFYVFILHKYFAHACAMGVSDPLHHKVLEAHCATVKTLC